MAIDYFQLTGKTALVTGASSGLGEHFARVLASEGATVVVAARREEKLAELVADINANGGKAHALKLDVADKNSVADAFATVERDIGGIDILINNAGLGTSKTLIEMEDDEWFKVIDVTLNGTMRMTRHMMRVMKARGNGGVIVNNASVLGWRAQKEQSHYAAAKAGVMALTRCAALEAAEFGVRINAVSPSLAVHPMLKKSAPAELLAELEGKEAYGRGAEVWEIANIMMFLASDYSSYLTGEIISCSSQRA